MIQRDRLGGCGHVESMENENYVKGSVNRQI